MDYSYSIKYNYYRNRINLVLFGEITSPSLQTQWLWGFVTTKSTPTQSLRCVTVALWIKVFVHS